MQNILEVISAAGAKANSAHTPDNKFSQYSVIIAALIRSIVVVAAVVAVAVLDIVLSTVTCVTTQLLMTNQHCDDQVTRSSSN